MNIGNPDWTIPQEKIETHENRVYRINSKPSGAVRIDRQTKWGNPYVINKKAPDAVVERNRVINEYRKTLKYRLESGRITLRELANLADKAMACWCAPLPCHGDVLVEAADWAQKRIKNG